MKHKYIVFKNTLSGKQMTDMLSLSHDIASNIPVDSRFVLFSIVQNKPYKHEQRTSWTAIDNLKSYKTFSNIRKANKHINDFIKQDSKFCKKKQIVSSYAKSVI
jgi:hypothetical protein